MPLLVAPVAFQRVAHPDGEVGMARGREPAGTVMCLSTLRDRDARRRSRRPAVARWFQLYVFRDEGVTRELVAARAEAGFTALVLTVDTPVLGRRERDLRSGLRDPARRARSRRSGRAG